jgi:hypothetical protein
MPGRVNEISGLMIIEVGGGALIPRMVLINKIAGISMRFVVLVLLGVYIFFTYFILKIIVNNDKSSES